MNKVLPTYVSTGPEGRATVKFTASGASRINHQLRYVCFPSGSVTRDVSHMSMGKASKKFILATKQEIGKNQRKLAWFSVHKSDLYYEMAGFHDGSHSSYHKDGSIWRTSPATEKKPKYIKHHYPLKHFQGWLNMGIGMLLKTAFINNPELKGRDKKHCIQYVDVDSFPCDTLNLVIELIRPNQKELLQSKDMEPPKDAQIYEFLMEELSILVTILGHEHNLLVSPYDGDFKGVTCRHFNKRYTASPPGGNMEFEAYSNEKDG